MISIIICSIRPDYLKSIAQNIQDTIGVPYELIAINNQGTGKGICHVYNAGVARAKYDILCFMHEDIDIKTLNWGKTLVNLFKDEQLGVVGVAGSAFVPITPSTGGGLNNEPTYINVLQSFKFKEKEMVHDYQNPHNEQLSEVAILDGVFLSTTKKVTNEFSFDEETCNGFHGYDVDFSLAVSTKYKNAVTYDILLNHFSEGNFDKKWMLDNIKVFNKWNHILPINIKKISQAKAFEVEKATFKHFVYLLLSFELPVSAAYITLWKNNTFLRAYPSLFFKLNFYTFKKVLAKKMAKS